MENKEQVYCSLDIETTGFDPLKNEILEVGFAFFKLTEKGVRITEEWTQVFCPSQEVPPNILGLTGISREELSEAPKFGDFRGFLQDKLGNAAIVGHNVIFDIRFLESFGIKFAGPVIDTLDLVQFILPTHHSYNLENLMHTFSVSHKDAHRALADSKAALIVLEKLLRVYNGFPEALKAEILALSDSYKFAWAELLKVPLNGEIFENSQPKPALPKAPLGLKIKPGKVYNMPWEEDLAEFAARLVPATGKKLLLVIPKIRQVMELWKKGRVEPVFPPELLFNEKKFKSLLKNRKLDKDEAGFLLKVLVWRYTNWQAITILDLNLTFFGGQYRSLITGVAIKEQRTDAVICCDAGTFRLLAEKGLYRDRHLAIAGLNDFEQQMSSDISTKTGWHHIIYVLKSIYNPELKTGEAGLQKEVEEALADTDLFFGLANALLGSSSGGFSYAGITPDVEHTENYGKLKKAAEHYCKKIGRLNKSIESAELETAIKALKDFFVEQPNRVRWLELAENRCVFFNSPLDISGLVQSTLSAYKDVTLVDGLGADRLFKYFLSRLGMQNFQIEPFLSKAAPRKKRLLLQGDLFSGAVSVRQGQSVSCHISSSLPDFGTIYSQLKEGPLPAAVLFSSGLQVRQFYEQYYQDLLGYASLFVQNNSGGGNKIFRNFSINKKSILLATDKFVLKQVSQQNLAEPVSCLAVKALVLCRLPFEQFTHPYLQAVSGQFENAFEEFSLPRAVYNLHCLLKFFSTPSLEQIYICDPKLNKHYAKAFTDYVLKLPGVALAGQKESAILPG